MEIEKTHKFDGFIITIDDGFCAHEYKFNPKEGGDLSIQQIMDRLCADFQIEKIEGKLVREFKLK